MGHEHLGEKTLLFIVDGLYGKSTQNYDKNDRHKWQNAPFNDDWSSSLFVSQDFVAIKRCWKSSATTSPTSIPRPSRRPERCLPI